MNKLKAFTVMELIVVMLISVIIISVSYKSYQIIENQVYNFMKRNSELTENILFKNVIYKTLDNSDVIKIHDDIIECSEENNTIRFSFYDNFVLYENNNKNGYDTFFVRANIVDFNVIPESTITDTIIKSINIDIINTNDTIGVFFYKEYSIEQLFKINHL